MQIRHSISLAVATALLGLMGCSSNGDALPPQDKPLYLYQPTNQGWHLDREMEFVDGAYSAEVTLGKGVFEFRIADSDFTCGTNFGASDAESLIISSPNAVNSCKPVHNFQLKVFKPGRYTIALGEQTGNYTLTVNREVTEQEKAAAAAALAAGKPAEESSCSVYEGGPVEVAVGSTFAEGELVRDFYSGQTAKVVNGRVTLTPAPESDGLLLLEPAEAKASEFDWDNATVYFVMTDRFYNGDPSNDNSYGRKKDGKDEIGTFHGGDLKGLTEKLDHIESLGVNAIWITAPYEQIHGWIGGGIRGDFPHYAYHGYYVQDYTKLDKNMGSPNDLRTFIEAAHKRGIRVLFDVVMNHTGYATLADMQEFNFGAFQDFDKPLSEVLGVEKWNDWQPGAGETWHSFNNFIDYGNPAWGQNWWGKGWIRTDIGGYDKPGRNDRTMMLAYLPDFLTESTNEIGLPKFYANKPDTNAKEIPGATVRQYLITWLTDWVREYGVDGFRVDTAKHVETEAWAELKVKATEALAEWKANNPSKKLDDAPFWMTGEVWGHGVTKSEYFSDGKFDSIINFRYQDKESGEALSCVTKAENTFSRYASSVNSDPDFNVLSYLSSHDTKLFFDRNAKQDIAQQKKIAAPFLLLPGGVQIFYGDETARPIGPSGSDKLQGTRSDMNWDFVNDAARVDLFNHWQKIGQFRNRHVAIGAGEHTKVSSEPYAFSRVKGDDRVMVVFAGQ